MTTVYLLLGLGFLLPVGSFWHTIARDAAEIRTERDIARILALAPERESLLPEDFHHAWPQRQTPSDLPPRVGLVVAVDPRPGRHHIGVALGTEEQRRRWNSPTGQFATLVAATWTEEEQATLSLDWWCESCQDDHKGCNERCACPCTLVWGPGNGWHEMACRDCCGHERADRDDVECPDCGAEVPG